MTIDISTNNGNKSEVKEIKITSNNTGEEILLGCISVLLESGFLTAYAKSIGYTPISQSKTILVPDDNINNTAM